MPRLEAARGEAEEVHVLFNTNRADQGPRNALRLVEQLRLPHPFPPSRPKLEGERPV